MIPKEIENLFLDYHPEYKPIKFGKKYHEKKSFYIVVESTKHKSDDPVKFGVCEIDLKTKTGSPVRKWAILEAAESRLVSLVEESRILRIGAIHKEMQILREELEELNK